MPFFIVLASDRAGALSERLPRRQEHLDYWTAKPGVVKVAGAMLAGDVVCGSSLLIEAEDEEHARELIAGDPFTIAGVFAGETYVVRIRPAIGEWLPAS